MRVDTPEARAFYEIEATESNWSTRELERQINSLLYERLAMSKDKNDAVVQYTLGPEQSKKIFASRYKFHLPSEAELRDELQREVRQLTSARPLQLKGSVSERAEDRRAFSVRLPYRRFSIRIRRRFRCNRS